MIYNVSFNNFKTLAVAKVRHQHLSTVFSAKNRRLVCLRSLMALETSYAGDASPRGLVGTLLSGTALSWFAPLLEKDSPVLYNFEAFVHEFSATFGEVDKARVAETKLWKLLLGSQLASIYPLEFRKVTCDLTWRQFRWGLRDDVKDLMLTMPKVYTLNKFILQFIECDNRLFERRQERRMEAPPKVIMATQSSEVESQESQALIKDLMQIDATQFQPLTP